MSFQSTMDEIKTRARAQAEHSKSAGTGMLDQYTPNQLSEMADRLEALGDRHSAADRIVEMRQKTASAQQSPEALAAQEVELRKMAHQRALQEVAAEMGLGKIGSGGIPLLDLVFPDPKTTATKLAYEGAEVVKRAVSHLLASALDIGLNPLDKHK